MDTGDFLEAALSKELSSRESYFDKAPANAAKEELPLLVSVDKAERWLFSTSSKLTKLLSATRKILLSKIGR